METRTRQVPFTTMRTETKTRTIPVQRMRSETRTRQVPFTVQVPQTRTRQVTVMQCQPQTRTQTYTVQVPETYTEQVPRQVCVRVPRTIQVPAAAPMTGCNSCGASANFALPQNFEASSLPIQMAAPAAFDSLGQPGIPQAIPAPMIQTAPPIPQGVIEEFPATQSESPAPQILNELPEARADDSVLTAQPLEGGV